MPDELFNWPKDLLQPEAVLILKIDLETRTKRVQARNDAINNNDWEEKLRTKPGLADRIQCAFTRIKANNIELTVHNNDTKNTVLENALQALNLFKEVNPLMLMRSRAEILGYCDPRTGVRISRKGWNMQIAFNAQQVSDDSSRNAAPALRSVGQFSIDCSGIIFVACGLPGGGSGEVSDDSIVPASILWLTGEDTDERQWTADGIVRPISFDEINLMRQDALHSLRNHMSASMKVISGSPDSKQSYRTELTSVLQDHYDKSIAVGSEVESARAFRFIPLRLEVQLSGPSSGGSKRFEWIRSLSIEASYKWSLPLTIFPYSLPGSIVKPRSKVADDTRPVTAIFIGSNTLSEMLSTFFAGKLKFDHAIVYDDKSSDEHLFELEVLRDQQYPNESNRIVEKGHIGNLIEVLERNSLNSLDDLYKQVVGKAVNAIKEDMNRGRRVVVLVQSIPSDITAKRSIQLLNVEPLFQDLKLPVLEVNCDDEKTALLKILQFLGLFL